MTYDIVEGYLETAMHRFGFSYAWESGFMVLTAGIGSRRWKMAIKCMENRFVFYAAYPLQLPHENRARMLEHLNTMNAQSGFGAYFLLDTEQGLMIVCRCDVLIPDEYSIFECIESGLKFISAELYSKWGALQLTADS